MATLSNIFRANSLKGRVRSGLLMGAALLIATIWFPPSLILIVLLSVCAMATLEFYALLDAAKIQHFKIIGLLAGLALVASTWSSLRFGNITSSYEWEWFILFAATVVILLRIFPQKHNPKPLQTLAATFLGVIYVPFLFNFFTKLLMAWGPEAQGRLLVIYLVVIVKCSDIGAFFVGCSIGRHKLLARVSPAKSWEGCIGGVLTAIIASILFTHFRGGDFVVVQISMPHALTIGLLLGICGILGDLTESFLKRAAEVKDSGKIISGMGGLLDVIDSLLFSAPALYIYARLFLEQTH